MKSSTKNGKKSDLVIWVVVILCLIAYLGIKISDEASQPTDEERFGSVPSAHYNHPLLEARMDGTSLSLTGDVAITVIFTSDSLHPWDPVDMAKQKAQAQEAADAMETAAAKYGADLAITLHYLVVTDNEPYPLRNNEEYRDWLKATTKKAGLGAPGGVTDKLKDKYGTKEAPVVFFTNEKDRSHARHTDVLEAAVCFRGSDASTFAHEVAHLFGAADFYEPDALAELAEEYFPDSLMLHSENPGDFDELTAYLVGWTDTLSNEALSFLRKSRDIDLTDEPSITTGGTGNTTPGASYGTVAWSNGTYTGELYDGWPHGSGTLVIEVNGKQAKYVGEYVHGEIEGYGTYYYTDGSSFAGYWKAGRQNGEGTYTDASGKETTGIWKDGAYQGTIPE